MEEAVSEAEAIRRDLTVWAVVWNGVRGAGGAAVGGSRKGVVVRCRREEDQDAAAASASCRRKQLRLSNVASASPLGMEPTPWHHIMSIERLGRGGSIFR